MKTYQWTRQKIIFRFIRHSLNVFVVANYDVGKLFLNLSLSWDILPELKNTHDGLEGILGPLSNSP